MCATRAIAQYNRGVRGDIFGHPRGLAYLFATEMWERFSYYGMRALLVLYMVKFLLDPRKTDSVVGLISFKTMLETIFGPLATQPLASQIYGFYTGLVYLTPIFGGLLADRVLGQRRTVIVGATLMAIGHFMMAFEQLFLFALGFLILGNGAFKPNISTQVGSLVSSGRSAPRPCLFDFLCWHQSWGFPCSACLRHARRRVRLALWLCRCRRRNDAWPHHLSHRHAKPAERRICKTRAAATTD